MQHSKRPVRLVPRIYDETSGEYPSEQDRRHVERMARRHVNAEYELMVERLEGLSTEQLAAVAKREHVGVSTRLGRGARKRLLNAIARKRLRDGWRTSDGVLRHMRGEKDVSH